MGASGLLSPYRVLDLADETGILAGKVLADLGADVIAVESPGGNPVRRLGPFYKGRPHPERSLVWWAYSSGKRSVTLDLEAEDGPTLLKQLVETADFVFESFPPGYLDRLGLGYKALKQVNPRLIMVSMTPFGQDGPYASYQGPDLVGMALGGLVNLTGDPDR
ncbi:MAG: CoA transferase, partial [Dehalococcoidia bacterium]